MTQPTTRVAFQGEYGAYSEMAARSYFGETVAVMPCPNFHALFNAVESGEATHGMVPIENTLMGGILDNYDLLLERSLFKMIGGHQGKVTRGHPDPILHHFFVTSIGESGHIDHEHHGEGGRGEGQSSSSRIASETTPSEAKLQ